ncbi:MAG: glycosyltransferase [Clostridium sp.]|uniref:glycosyltransferase n=1 Tax=Clostridium sp. TaxID=1506 RepID=UPI0025C26DE9|nr:glycosyltransferase [Clostridium sp.]MCI6690960.1 glycosyltransferase [Clostridium sp.]MDY2632609.1 glycosyltransferase [Clostridium sp.]MDY4252154.1 glycosyltransferase [Clostridium sp.]MDY6226483.1 glycosyltransferase [Clostridium sp.]
MKEFISCIIVTYNTDENIINVIDSLEKQVSQIIIVDNGSNDKTKNILNKFLKTENIDIIYNYDNYGIAKALNIGIKRALEYKSDWILTLDHDSILDKDMISKMLNFYNNLLDEEKKKVGILAPEILDVSINRSYYNIEENISYKKVEHVIQSGSLIKASIFKDIGFFNEKLFIYYVDTEFCFNVRKHRYEIFMVKEAILFHEEGKKERRIFCGLEFTYDNYSNQAIYYISRNSIYMFRKYKKITFIMRIIYDFIKILLAEPKKIKYLFYGIKDGVLKIYGKKSKW